MTEFYVELQDANGTYYGTIDFTGEAAYFDDLDEARMFAKAQLDEQFILSRIVNDQTGRIIDFFEYHIT
jgi:hypothetical protein